MKPNVQYLPFKCNGWVMYIYSSLSLGSFCFTDGPELTCQSSYTAPEYAPHNLTCNAVGYPKPVIRWFKEDEEVELPKILTRSDAGQYVITASNNRSSVNYTVEITVLCKLF